MRTLKESAPIALRLVDLGTGSERRYRVMHGDEATLETAVLAYAEIEYDEQYDRLWSERPDRSPKERLQREQEHGDLQAVRSEAFERRAKASRPKGGRGGRGGV